MQQQLKKINVHIELQPMILSQLCGNEISGDYLMSLLGAAMNFDDPIDTFGQQALITASATLHPFSLSHGSSRRTEGHRGDLD
jgi:hypothetical protein